MNSKLRIIVAGLIAQYPIGGVTWDYLQYVLGLARLGHDVYYLEDSSQWPYNPIEAGLGGDGSYNASYLSDIMDRFDLSENWAYRFPGGELPSGKVLPENWFCASDKRRIEFIGSADLLINVSSGIGDPSRYRRIPNLVYVDTDPVFTQLRVLSEPHFREHVDVHDVHFSYGECIRDSGPTTGHQWHPIRKPILVSEWHPLAPHRDAFTTVMNWTSYKDMTYDGQHYGQKDLEFMRFVELPNRVSPTVLEIALAVGNTRHPPRGLLTYKGWHLVDPMEVCPDLDRYREYIQSSKAEWTVAKHGYMVGQTGWFSGRSACYLAAGRPVVVQDTGFSSVLPVGDGILAFSTIEEAVDAIHHVNIDYLKHSNAAREIALEYFDSKKVLKRLIEQV
jgi:hypothetical protein